MTPPLLYVMTNAWRSLQSSLLTPSTRACTRVQAIELKDGVYYPLGGFGRVVDGLERVCGELGVEFRFNCPVEEVSCYDTGSG